jgi:hypothetical protein
MSARSAIVWLILLCGCYRTNSRYCDEMTPCADPALTCNLAARQCQPEGADMRVPEDMRVDVDLKMSMPDLLMVDMNPGPACTTHVECAMASAATPACIMGKCRPCTRNYQCPDSACDDDGRCHGTLRTIVVDNRVKCRGTNGMGGAGDPYCYLREAVQDAELGTTKDLILVRTGTRLDGLFIDLPTSMRIVGARTSATQDRVVISEPIRFASPTGIGASINVGIEDLHLAGLGDTGANGIHCYKSGLGSASLTLRWSRIDGSPVWGLLSDQCGLRTISSQFTGNGMTGTNNGGGAKIVGGDVLLLNNFFTGNVIGLDISLVSLSSTAAFNTFGGNRCQSNNGCNARCMAGYKLQYSIMLGATANEAFQNCVLENSYVPGNYNNGTTNLKNLSLVFANPMNGDYHLDPNNAMNKMLRKDEPPAGAMTRTEYDIDDEPRLGVGGVIVGADQIPLP